MCARACVCVCECVCVAVEAVRTAARGPNRTSASWQKSANGLSNTIASTDIRPSSSKSLAWYKIPGPSGGKGLVSAPSAQPTRQAVTRGAPVTAPIERPHTAMLETVPDPRRWSTTTLRSSRSNQPKLTNRPSDFPEPAQSNANTVAPIARHTAMLLST